ncbi:MAG: hypothetical protein ACP5E3_00020, partial [Bacteroidales bacterium]
GCLVEYYGKPKMAYYYAKKSCSQVDISCVYEDLECRPDKPLDMEVWVSNLLSDQLEGSRYRWRIFNTNGKLLWKEEKSVDIPALKSDIAGKIRWRPSPDMGGDVALVYVELMSSADSIMADHLYTFGIRDVAPAQQEGEQQEPLLRGLLEAPGSRLEIMAKNVFVNEDQEEWRTVLEIKNREVNNALLVRLDAETTGDYQVYFDRNYFFLPAGETCHAESKIVFPGPEISTDQVVFTAKAWNSAKESATVELK